VSLQQKIVSLHFDCEALQSKCGTQFFHRVISQKECGLPQQKSTALQEKIHAAQDNIQQPSFNNGVRIKETMRAQLC
jgi:hypothetical protein